MTWVRGLTRLYVVIWIAFAAHGAWRAIKSTNAAYKPKKVVDRFLARHPGTVTVDELRTLDLDSLATRIWIHPARSLSAPQRRALLLGGRDSAIGPQEQRELLAARLAASDKRFLRPGRHVTRGWIKWAVLRLFLPAIALLAARWVYSGFVGRNGART